MTARMLKACVAAAACVVAGCNSGMDAGAPHPTQAAANIAVPTIAAGSAFSFDLGTVVNGKYYLTDRNNKAVDVVDTNTLAFTQIKGTGANAFAGCAPTADCKGANNGLSRPRGIPPNTGANI